MGFLIVGRLSKFRNRTKGVLFKWSDIHMGRTRTQKRAGIPASGPKKLPDSLREFWTTALFRC